MRDKNTMEELFEIEKKIRETNTQNDQGVLNKYCDKHNCNTELFVEFNATTNFCNWFKYKNNDYEMKKLFNFFNLKITNNFKPLFRHFTGLKPWNDLLNDGYVTPNFFDWWYYYSMTDFYEECITVFEKINSKKVEKINSIVGNSVINNKKRYRINNFLCNLVCLFIIQKRTDIILERNTQI